MQEKKRTPHVGRLLADLNPDVVASEALEEAIRRSSRSVSPKAIGRSGIESIRVLSESKFQRLVAEIVERRLRERESVCVERLAPEAGAEDETSCEIPVDDDGLPIVIVEECDDPLPPAGSLIPELLSELFDRSAATSGTATGHRARAGNARVRSLHARRRAQSS